MNSTIEKQLEEVTRRLFNREADEASPPWLQILSEWSTILHPYEATPLAEISDGTLRSAVGGRAPTTVRLFDEEIHVDRSNNKSKLDELKSEARIAVVADPSDSDGNIVVLERTDWFDACRSIAGPKRVLGFIGRADATTIAGLLGECFGLHIPFSLICRDCSDEDFADSARVIAEVLDRHRPSEFPRKLVELREAGALKCDTTLIWHDDDLLPEGWQKKLRSDAGM